MKEIVLARIAYFVGMSRVAAIMAGHEITVEDAGGILKNIKTSTQAIGVDIYELKKVTLEEVKQVMQLINPNWR